jgi:hypothetical protein
MAGFATRSSFAGHADSSANANHELTSIPDHLKGSASIGQRYLYIESKRRSFQLVWAQIRSAIPLVSRT